MNDIELKVKSAVEGVIAELGYELVDVEYKSEYGNMTLTVYVHSSEEGGTSLATCERVHHAIDGLLDECDPTGGAPYMLNVSSPGLDRPFKTLRDFERNLGKDVEVKLKKQIDKKNYATGKLISFAQSSLGFEVTLEVKGKEMIISSDYIKLVRPLVVF